MGGNFDNSTIANCHATETVTGTGTGAKRVYAGGLAGGNFDNSTISNCHATETVTGTGNLAAVGGLV